MKEEDLPIECPRCHHMINSVDDPAFNILNETFPKAHAIDADGEGADTNLYCVDFSPSFRVVLEFGKDEAWRVKEVWIETKEITLNFGGKRAWRKTPEEAIYDALNGRKASVYDIIANRKLLHR